MVRLAVIGAGSRGLGMARLMHEVDGDVRLAAVADPAIQQAQNRVRLAALPGSDKTRFYTSADDLLQLADQYDGVLIGTRCYLHGDLAVQVAHTGLPLFLEKPVAITHEQLTALNGDYKNRHDLVVISFPLRTTPLFRSVLQIVRSGRLGTINQIQAINNVPYGGCYFGRWYRNYDQTGGLWLQKATHDFDYLNALLGSPTTIAATSTRNIYDGDMPHDLKCSACDKASICLESPQAHVRRGTDGGMGKNDHWCAFSTEIRNQDAGSALVLYADGTHASYAQNFATRFSAGSRGSTIIGQDATLQFNWYGETIYVVEHHQKRVDDIVVPSSGGHGGGDHAPSPKLHRCDQGPGCTGHNAARWFAQRRHVSGGARIGVHSHVPTNPASRRIVPRNGTSAGQTRRGGTRGLSADWKIQTRLTITKGTGP